MISVQAVMTHDHKKCDDYFSQAENFVLQKNWNNTNLLTEKFHQAMQLHFTQEEDKLFPAFEQATGMHDGPTADENSDRYLGLTATLQIFMQQHNMKEEQILYPMIDQQCSADVEQLMSGFANTQVDIA